MYLCLLQDEQRRIQKDRESRRSSHPLCVIYATRSIITSNGKLRSQKHCTAHIISIRFCFDDERNVVCEYLYTAGGPAFNVPDHSRVCALSFASLFDRILNCYGLGLCIFVIVVYINSV